MVPENSADCVPAEVDTSNAVAIGAAVAPTWHEDDPVQVRYSLPDNDEHGRFSWPWLPGTILAACGPDEWQICAEVRELATLEDGCLLRRNTPARKLFYPVCFRDSSEIRARSASDKRAEVGQ